MQTTPPPTDTATPWRKAPSDERSRSGRWRAALREYVAFAGALLRSPRTVGAVCPSSRALARAMVAGFDLGQASLVVELGPGTGAFTEVIAAALGPATRFLALELDAGAVDHLRRRFPHLTILHDSAERVLDHLRALKHPHADYVVSGLPWAILPADVQTRTMQAIAEALKPGGVFTTFAYLHARRSAAARRYWQMLPGLFRQVDLSRPVWANLPPAVVYRCHK